MKFVIFILKYNWKINLNWVKSQFIVIQYQEKTWVVLILQNQTQ